METYSLNGNFDENDWREYKESMESGLARIYSRNEVSNFYMLQPDRAAGQAFIDGLKLCMEPKVQSNYVVVNSVQTAPGTVEVEISYDPGAGVGNEPCQIYLYPINYDISPPLRRLGLAPETSQKFVCKVARPHETAELIINSDYNGDIVRSDAQPIPATAPDAAYEVRIYNQFSNQAHYPAANIEVTYKVSQIASDGSLVTSQVSRRSLLEKWKVELRDGQEFRQLLNYAEDSPYNKSETLRGTEAGKVSIHPNADLMRIAFSISAGYSRADCRLDGKWDITGKLVTEVWKLELVGNSVSESKILTQEHDWIGSDPGDGTSYSCDKASFGSTRTIPIPVNLFNR
jgi:hypothetical protein